MSAKKKVDAKAEPEVDLDKHLAEFRAQVEESRSKAAVINLNRNSSEEPE